MHVAQLFIKHVHLHARHWHAYRYAAFFFHTVTPNYLLVEMDKSVYALSARYLSYISFQQIHKQA